MFYIYLNKKILISVFKKSYNRHISIPYIQMFKSKNNGV